MNQQETENASKSANSNVVLSQNVVCCRCFALFHLGTVYQVMMSNNFVNTKEIILLVHFIGTYHYEMIEVFLVSHFSICHKFRRY